MKDAYRKAIARACEKADIPQWTPYRLRHSVATRLRKEFNMDLARIILGHSDVRMTQVYAEADRQQAIAAMARVA